MQKFRDLSPFIMVFYSTIHGTKEIVVGLKSTKTSEVRQKLRLNIVTNEFLSSTK